jgi:hypothetical protein
MAYLIVQGICVLWVIGTEIVFSDDSTIAVGRVISQALLPHSSFIWLLDNQSTSIVTHPEVGLHALFAVPMDLVILGLLVKHYRSGKKAQQTMETAIAATIQPHSSVSAAT